MPIELNEVTSGYNLSLINENFQTIENAWDEKLDRLVSTQSNELFQDLDMNGNEILNATFEGENLVDIIEDAQSATDAANTAADNANAAANRADATIEAIQVYSIEQLKLRDVATDLQLYLADGDLSGWFVWQTGDFTSQVSNDTFNGVYVPSDSDPTGSAGCWVRVIVDSIALSWFGVTGTNDLQRVKSAGNISLALDKPLLVDVTSIDLTGRTSLNDMIYLSKGIIVERDSDLTFDGFGLPVFIARDQDGFSVTGRTLKHICAITEDPTGDSTTSLSDFETAIGESFGYAGVNNNTLTKTVYCLLDSKNITFDNLAFEGQSSSGNDQFNLFWIGPLADGTVLTEDVLITNITAKDYVMGLNSSNFKDLRIDNIHLGDYYPFPTNPGHFVYISSDNGSIQQSENVTISNVFDSGHAKTDASPVGETTLKVYRCKDLNTYNIISYRQGGAVEVGNIEGGVINFIAYRTESTATRFSRYGFRDIGVDDSASFPSKNFIVNGEIWASGQADDRWFELNRATSSADREGIEYNIVLREYDSSVNGNPLVAYTDNCEFNLELKDATLSDDTIFSCVTVTDSTFNIKHSSDATLRIATDGTSLDNIATISSKGRSIILRETNFGEITSKLADLSNVYQVRLSSGGVAEGFGSVLDNEAVYQIVLDCQNSDATRRNIITLRGISSGTTTSVQTSNDILGTDGIEPSIVETANISFTDESFWCVLNKPSGVTEAIAVTATFKVIGLLGTNA